ncbi:MAG: polyribonucleotide nucleotidyltransferase [Candidatus Harrisonbacteria bacterium CG10_big_fil_rev_8_21_14_0_10_49_15]|uniref:Polyribonucleotide nucleotidyltransferase n=1 Tax=Candidatus Harrisonbacteria bacterium CG10_big_fil_rev_8_21_14_0_10_49_15 TaxID=1974587 RepID=A0A2H0UKG5_9BACT|nr:MAG: polyribonucleotide nucleotidyltransferase [Candidatus Harrisonbacteria bacterium CG10_big_fil_rev_8_21_14_0_10_49_15]
MNLNRQQFTTTHAGRPLTLEVSELANQANAAVLGKYGDSALLATVVMGKESNLPYFPLQVIYEERFYAIGKILGSRFMRREGRPSEEAVLSGRVIDRVIRPLFDNQIRREIQVVITILSLDPKEDLDFLALMTASAALAISSVPWAGPVAGVRVVKKDDRFLLNPRADEAEGFTIDSFVAGKADRINMIELEGREADEADVVAAFEMASKEVEALIKFQQEMVAKIGKPKVTIETAGIDEELRKIIAEFAMAKLEEAIYLAVKTEREAALEKIRAEIDEHLVEKEVEDEKLKHVDHILEEIIDGVVHKNVLDSGKRPDGRALDEVRPLYGEVGLLAKTHGSGLFIRGGTQALAVTTVGAPGDEQLVESMTESKKQRFLLHYNFPPYSVGETGFFRGPGRREIGHGALARKALQNMLPAKEDFPYTLRIVSEILASNGSSSMATVCAGTLSMMDAGVPLKKPVAGIAMGLMSNKSGDYKILTDIQGYEDHYGDADFKVAGTTDGVTAIQMDVKIEGLTVAMLREGLAQARVARMQILEVMKGVLPAPRPELSPLAPHVLSLKIPSDMIGLVIGPGGKTINGIIEKTGALSIDIEEDGTVFIAGDSGETAKAALEEVRALTKTYDIGELVTGTVIKLLEFGGIVEMDAGQDGMVHISEVKDGFVKDIKDVLEVGQRVKAKIIKMDHGKIGLSMKGIEQS